MTLVKNKNKSEIIDVLAWDLFKKGAVKREYKMPINCTLDNRLIASTKNFFVVSGLGAFTPGYYLIITKNFYGSFAQINDEEIVEYNWLISTLNESLEKNYNKNSAIFEHGMCSCAGGLDHAHVHMMPVPKNLNNNGLEEIINQVLKKRSAGIQKIKFNNHMFDNVHDISTIINFHDNYEIIDGKLLKLRDLKNFEENFDKMRSLLLKEEQYINFNVPVNKFLFCTKHYLGTQFGREVVSEICFKYDNKIKEYFSSLSRSDPTKLIWRWQDYNFEKNIIQTIKDLSEYLKLLKNNNNYKKFQMEIFVK